MKLWGTWEHSQCPCCKADNETTDHVLSCNDTRMRHTWNEHVEGIETWLEATDTHPIIQECFLSVLRERDLNYSFPTEADGHLRRAWHLQRALGWANFIEGKLVCEWQSIQARHLSCINSRKSASTWASNMVVHLLEMVHAMWTTRNGILHELATNGKKREVAQQMEQVIRDQFAAGNNELHPCDHHYLERGIDAVLSMDGIQQQAWIDGVEAARISYSENRDADIESMRQSLRHWLQSQ